MMDEGSRMANFVTLLLVVYCAFLSGPFCHAFTFGTRIVGKMHSRSHISMEWKGDRPPLPNMEFLDQRMDAAWGRGKFRDEVWNDNTNPLNNWWTAFAPSEEQIEAAAQGYDFKNPQSYFEEKNIDYEKALAKYEEDKKKAYEEYKRSKEQEWNDFKEEDLASAQEKYFRLLKIGYEKKLRERDNELQAKKGVETTETPFKMAKVIKQPNLEEEDTGVQWKNDPV